MAEMKITGKAKVTLDGATVGHVPVDLRFEIDPAEMMRTGQIRGHEGAGQILLTNAGLAVTVGMEELCQALQSAMLAEIRAQL